MTEPTTLRFVGLDVHRDSIVIAVASPGREPARSLGSVPHDVTGLITRLLTIAPAEGLRCCYEAGPTGYGLARRLQQAGIDCVVIAPSLVPIKPGLRIKTDRRDARKLAQHHRAGELTVIHVPDAATEAIRDLERARDAAKRAERAARHQLTKFLLRHDRSFTEATSWGTAHRAWLKQQRFEHPAQQAVLNDYREAVELATDRVARLTAELVRQVAAWDQAPLVTALAALRGVDLISAATLVAEVGDFRRFATAPELMAYVGLVPSEHSSGGSRRQGRITRTGNGHVRRTLVESAWHYRRLPARSRAIRERNERVSGPVRAIAWKAQQRLHRRLTRLLGRGMAPQRAVTAVARELVGFVWAIAREPQLLAD